MWTRRSFLGVAAMALPAAAQFPPSDVERELLAERADALGKAVEKLRGKQPDHLVAEVEVFHKALVWLLADDEEFHRRIYAHDALSVAAEGMERAQSLAEGQAPWTLARGWTARAYRSQVDGSVQPYLLWVPSAYDAEKPPRLDLILHGRNSRLTETSFLASAERKPTTGPDYPVLEVFGRTNNAYRWSGEADVLEALAEGRKTLSVDPHRIVLRGFSMGGAGAWHLGLHHPDRWAAFEAGAGFNDTLVYAKNSLKGGLAGDWQRETLHVYDAADYAENAHMVPTVGYGGEDDKQLQSSINVRENLAKAGAVFQPDGLNFTTDSLNAVFLVGPKTGHRFHPDSKERSNRFIDDALAAGPRRPDSIRFVTYTTKYPKCFWATIDGLEKHYDRADLRLERDAARTKLSGSTKNVSRLIIADAERLESIELDGQSLKPIGRPLLWLGKQGGRWKTFDSLAALRGDAPVKRPGLQGPIDDAFTAPFLAVVPDSGSTAVLDTFKQEYFRWLRAELPVVRASAVTEADIRDKHLALFGTPETNPLLAKVAGKLPMAWEPGLRLVAPNPLNPEKYVVVNSGHTFHEPEFRGTNALLFPRLGDWAVVDDKGEIQKAGIFNEDWKPA